FSLQGRRRSRHLHSFPTRRSSDLLFGKVLEIAIEHRKRRRAVEKRLLGLMRARVPGAQPEPGEVEHIQHLWHVALPHQRREAVRSESTRLNSSHVEISYAVFCLKK